VNLFNFFISQEKLELEVSDLKDLIELITWLLVEASKLDVSEHFI
jgi:hypothetical protein